MGIDSGKNSRPFFFFADRRNVPLSSKEFAEGLNILDQLTLFTEPSAPPNLAAQTPPFSLFFSLKKLCIYLFGCIRSLLRHEGSFVTTLGLSICSTWAPEYVGSSNFGIEILAVACGLWSAQAQELQHMIFVALRHVGSYFPDQGLNPSAPPFKADS